VPQDRHGRFSTELFERYQRSEKALVAALAEMYVQGVSTRKVRAITEELCGHSFSPEPTRSELVIPVLAKCGSPRRWRPCRPRVPDRSRSAPRRRRVRGAARR
jgi:hypothetical protein